MGILSKLFEKKEAREARQNKATDGLRMFMETFLATNKLGEKLKKKIPDNQRTDRIISAFAFGSLKIFATQWNLNQEEFYEVYAAYLDFGLFKGKPKKLKETRKWWDDQVKQGKRDGDFYKVMGIGEQATKDLAAQKLGNVLILYTTIMDENIKI